MTKDVLTEALVNILAVERIEDNFFRGIATPNGKGRSFGGQVIGQAVMSATQTVDADRPMHSLHAYFIRPGNAEQPVLYRVERDRDGGSFVTRRVIAVQNGQPILNLAASFHKSEGGMAHQDDMPNVPMPEDLPDEAAILQKYLGTLGDRYDTFLKAPRPIEMRPVRMRAPFETEDRSAVQHVWIRTRSPIGDDPALHRAALSYASDFALLGTSMLPHGKSFMDPDIQPASLDHAMWLHDDFRMDEWLLYAMDSPWAGGARGFNRGRVFTGEGRLVANVAQEGLIRQIDG